MKARSNAIFAAAAACILAGCSQDGMLTSPFNTGSITPAPTAAEQQAAKSTEALCLTLASQIEALNGEGVPEKVSKAAAKKYSLKAADIKKADELNKANGEFQTKCSSYPPRVAAAEPASTTPKTPGAPQKTAEAAKPPVPAQKPVTASLAQPAATPAAEPATPMVTTGSTTAGVTTTVQPSP